MNHIRLILLTILLLSVIFCSNNIVMGQSPPVARIDDIVDEYYGVKVADPYRYMENTEDPYVKKWIKEQGDYAADILTNLPARQKLLDRLLELDAGKPFNIWRYVLLKDGGIIYEKRMAGDNLSKVYLRQSSGVEKLLIDPENVPAGEGEHNALWAYDPSPDGRFVVYGLAKGGSEETVLHILEINSGEHLPETIDRIETAYNKILRFLEGCIFCMFLALL